MKIPLLKIILSTLNDLQYRFVMGLLIGSILTRSSSRATIDVVTNKGTFSTGIDLTNLIGIVLLMTMIGGLLLDLVIQKWATLYKNHLRWLIVVIAALVSYNTIPVGSTRIIDVIVVVSLLIYVIGQWVIEQRFRKYLKAEVLNVECLTDPKQIIEGKLIKEPHKDFIHVTDVYGYNLVPGETSDDAIIGMILKLKPFKTINWLWKLDHFSNKEIDAIK